jgi:uncharacterized protein (DUF342 family)
MNIIDILRVPGDVGPAIGNIHSEKDVFINGNINGGFTVECGGNLSVNGGIDNGAIVTCNKNLAVHQGIFGNHSKVVVLGDAEIGFIQDATIRIEGDLHVKKFIYNSNVYCAGQIIVEGSGVESTHGSVLGGKVIAMRSMILASAGCDGEDTHLYCGINPEVEKELLETKNKVVTFNKKVAALRSTIKLNLDDKEIKAKLQALSNQEKERIKKILLAIKILSQEQHVLSEKLASMEKVALYEKPELCSIEIRKHIIPTVYVKVSNNPVIEVDQAVNGASRFVKGN